MGRKKDISPTKVAQIVMLHHQGWTQRAIASKFNISQVTVQQRLKIYEKTGEFKSKKRTGRKRKTTTVTDRLIHRKVRSNPTISSSHLVSQLPTNVKISARTIRRRLQNNFNLSAYRPALKPKLSKKNVSDRLKFARKYVSINGEKYFSATKAWLNSFILFQRMSEDHLGNDTTQGTHFLEWKILLRLWFGGSLSYTGRGSLYIFPQNTTVTANVYLGILEEKLPFTMERHCCNYFQHDGAPAHKAKCVRSWLIEKGIQCLEPWPGSSPDLNPIENCWAILKQKLAVHKPTSLTDLIQKIKLVWCTEITQNDCASLVESMPSRLAAMIAAHGTATKY